MTSPVEPSRRNPQNSLRERQAYPNRNKPLFTKRPPQYEFFTDSLNESRLQSPSPPKKKEDINPFGASQRRSNGGARTLNAAFRATAGVRDENRPPSSSSSERKRTQFVPKPRPTQTSQRTPPRPAGGQRAKEPAGIGRGRTNTRVSAPSSTPSPPRGLREAYNRIVDEENLAAHQHDSEDGDADFEEHNQRRHELGSPAASKGLRRDSLIAESPTPLDDPNETNGSNEVKSAHGSESDATFSGLSFIENMTDDTFGKALADHARDEQRMSGALMNNGKIFRKAHVGERAGLTLENLQRRDRLNEAKTHGSSDMAGEESVNSDWSDPPVHVPSTWGRKGRAGNEWLNRINEPGGRLTGDLRSPVDDASQLHTKANEGQEGVKIDWLSAAADVPLPSVEEGSSLRRKSSRASTPTSGGKRNASLDRSRHWDIDNDFTARSIQVSTSPILKTRNSTLDHIRDREIQSLKGRAVTTNRLGEIRERSSEQQLRRPSAAGSDLMKDMETNTQRTAATKVEISKEIMVGRLEDNASDVDNAKPRQNEEGDPIPNTPIVVFKNTNHGSGKRRFDLERGPDDEATPQRPNHARQDSRDLLRKLARAASASPLSSNDPETKGELHAIDSLKNSPKPLDPRQDADKADVGTGSAKATSHPSDKVVDKEKLEVKHSSKEPLKSSAGKESRQNLAINTEDILAASGIKVVHSDKPGTETDNGRTPQVSRSTVPLKTPIVTGAWVDTPAQTAQQHPPSPPSDLDVDKEISALGIRDFIRGPSSSPLYRRGGGIEGRPVKAEERLRPKSALAAILSNSKADNKAAENEDDARDDDDKDAKAKDEEALGDSTIDSLEDMIANDTDFSSLLDFKVEEDLENTTPRDAKGQKLSTPERERRLEMLAYERMNQRLRTLRLSIRDAKRGIEGLEHKVEHAPAEVWPCPSCGCSSGGQRLRQRQRSSWRRYIPSLYTWSERGWPKPTWLGWLLLLVGAWCISEYTLCEIYCQPRYAYWMEGYGVDIYAPRMPWVTLTKIWEPFSWIILPVWKVLSWMAWQVYGQDAQQALLRANGINGSTSKDSARREPPYHFEKMNGIIFKVRDDVHDLGEMYPSQPETSSVGNTYVKTDTYSVKDKYSQKDRHGVEIPVSKDERIPRPSWAPDLSMMDDEYL
ncbi:MAG: hypothetical protein M1812_004854 [Candelaria pacifica]|nr:MAG: hypothetical protein M1812_004854 [Candelaria pacifica]